MPFDALVQPDALTALGIVPVAPEVLNRHKQKMMVRPLAWVTGLASPRWRYLPLSRETLETDLAHVRRLRVIGQRLPWRAAAPRSVRKLAIEVRDAIPNAQFSLGYIQNDPYLIVAYDGKQACLGIWYTRFRAVAIAQQTEMPR
jgi:hypothetical protein